MTLIEPSSIKWKILVIDDDESMQRALKRLFHLSKKYDVRAIGHGAMTMEEVHTWRPHLVVVDISMRRADGYQVCAAIRGDDQLDDTRIVVMSGSVEEHDLRRIPTVGADAYIAKPFENHRLLNEVDRLLGIVAEEVREL